MKRHRYSETLRTVAPILAQHPTGYDILRTVAEHERLNGIGEGDVDTAEALYWIGANYHNGQSCPLYALTSATGFNPGRLARGPVR